MIQLALFRALIFACSQACARIEGYEYLALGDPLQKKNYYRAGWLRFRDDADMAKVMTELTDKKVRIIFIFPILQNYNAIPDRGLQAARRAHHKTVHQSGSICARSGE